MQFLLLRQARIGVLLALLAGCGGAAQSSDDGQIRAAMKVLGMQYAGFLAAHNGAAPPDEAALRAYLQSQLGDLEGYGVKSVDQLLSAGRDGQPIQVLYGAKIASAGQSDLPWAAYEQTGVEGRRLAVNARGDVHELSAEEFSTQFPGR